MKTRTCFAQVASLAFHLTMLLALMFLASQSSTNSEAPPVRALNQRLIYVASAPGDGGGGGGSRLPAAPVALQVPKPQLMSVIPVVSAAPVETPLSIDAPVMTDSRALLTATGVDGHVVAPLGGGGDGSGIGPGAGPGVGSGRGPGFGNTGMAGTGGIDPPLRIREVRPEYTPEAMRAKVQGPVVLEAVLDVTGKVSDVRVVKSLDRAFGLDEAARRAAYATPFRPCRKAGTPVACVVVFELQFTLR